MTTETKVPFDTERLRLLLSEALDEIEALRAEVEALRPKPAPAPWYPDDSGEWVEVPDDLMTMPEGTHPDDVCEVVLLSERQLKRYYLKKMRVGGQLWGFPTWYEGRIVAYRIIQKRGEN